MAPHAGAESEAAFSEGVETLPSELQSMAIPAFSCLEPSELAAAVAAPGVRGEPTDELLGYILPE